MNGGGQPVGPADGVDGLAGGGAGGGAEGIAAALATTRSASLPRVDLLPPEIAERQRLQQVKYGLGGTVAAAGALVLALLLLASSGVRAAEQERTVAQAEHTALQEEAAAYRDVTVTHRRAAAAQAMLTEAMRQEVRYSGLLSDLSMTVPDQVWIKSVTFRQAPVPSVIGQSAPGIGTVAFVGMAFDHDDVAAWLDSLATQRGYADPTLTTSTVKRVPSGQVVEFTSSVTLTAEALRSGSAIVGG